MKLEVVYEDDPLDGYRYWGVSIDGHPPSVWFLCETNAAHIMEMMRRAQEVA